MSTNYFKNRYEHSTLDTGKNILNDSKDGIAEDFLSKLQNYQCSKLTFLLTELKSDIFYDGTVYTGSTGLAYYYYMVAQKSEQPIEVLKTALKYIDLKHLKNQRISFLCGDAGPLALATAILFKLSTKNIPNLPDYKKFAQRLISLSSLLDSSPGELLYGKSGYLYALLLVNKELDGEEIIPANHIKKVINSILTSGKQFAVQMKSESPLLWEWHGKIYLGAAHGMAGILYMLLQAHIYIKAEEIHNIIRPAVDWLVNQRFQSGNLPSSLNSSSGDRLVQWCHGAPGLVPLCILAAQVFEDDKYLEIALQCGDVIWQRGLCTKGYSICHGVSGNAYAFIQLYQATKKPKHLYRACCFMEWCMLERPGSELHRPDRPASLFEGLIGRLYLAHSIQYIQDAKFPAFTL